jgi:hypothetical protein
MLLQPIIDLIPTAANSRIDAAAAIVDSILTANNSIFDAASTAAVNSRFNPCCY